MDIFNLVKGACIFFYFLLTIFIMNSVCGNWRHLHTEMSNYAFEKAKEDALANAKSQTARENIQNWKFIPAVDDSVMVKYGILRTCEHGEIHKYEKVGELDMEKGPCLMPDWFGFYGDPIVASLLITAFIIYVGNFVYIIAASCTKIHEKALFVLPVTCGLATVIILGAIIYFACAWNLWWEYYITRRTVDSGYYGPEEVVNRLKDEADKHKDEFKTETNMGGKHKNMITFGLGFYLAIISLLFSIFATVLSAVIAFFGDRLPRGAVPANNNNAPAPPVTMQAPVTKPTEDEVSTPAGGAPPPQINIDVQAKV